MSVSEKVFVMRDEAARERVVAALQRVPLHDERGRPLLVLVKRKPRKRTLKQNALMHLMWGYCDVLFQWGKGEAKEWFKKEHGPVIDRTFGSGVNRRTATIAKPSAEYTVQEAEEMIDKIYRVAAEAGFVLPDPHDEQTWLEFAETLEGFK